MSGLKALPQGMFAKDKKVNGSSVKTPLDIDDERHYLTAIEMLQCLSRVMSLGCE
jgi:hypothetical protein